MSMTLGEAVIQKIDGFLFYRESAVKAAVFRIAFGIVLLLNLFLFYGHLSEWFSSEGILPASIVKSQYEPFSFSLFFWNDSPFFVQCCYWIVIGATALYTVGVFPQAMAIIMLILTVSFHNRMPRLFNAGDIAIRMALVANLFIDSSKRFSILNYFRRNNVTDGSVSGWPFRIIQFMLCNVYFFAAFSKATSSFWMTGEYVFIMMNFPGRGYLDALWLRHFPVIATLMTYSVLASELSFPFLVWQKKTRNLAIGMVFLMHLGIMLTINTVYFSEIMFVMLISFVDFPNKLFPKHRFR